MGLTPTALLASASDLLITSGYRAVDVSFDSKWQTSPPRLFEDPYCIVAIVAYETSEDLLHNWPEAQAMLVEVMAKSVARSEPKSWDAYLVLLTPSFADTAGIREVRSIRYDTLRLRKLIATGEDLKTLEDVRRTILPLLPVTTTALEATPDVLELLVEALVERGLVRDQVKRLIEAFATNRSLMLALSEGQ